MGCEKKFRWLFYGEIESELTALRHLVVTTFTKYFSAAFNKRSSHIDNKTPSFPKKSFIILHKKFAHFILCLYFSHTWVSPHSTHFAPIFLHVPRAILPHQHFILNEFPYPPIAEKNKKKKLKYIMMWVMHKNFSHFVERVSAAR